MPFSCTFYALKHKATGKFMPARLWRCSNAGFTYWEPTDLAGAGGNYPLVPRLFPSKHAASVAKTYWERGNAKGLYAEDSGSWDEPSQIYQAGVESLSPPIPRAKGDLEIVILTLKD